MSTPTMASEVAAANQEEDVPRYPPFMKGLPVTEPDRLIAAQDELVGRILASGMASPDDFRVFYLEALHRFAAYAHLLPASQSHHHRGAGGLLRHTIEVALWSLQAADRVLLSGAGTPQRRREIEPRWQLAVFLAGLCHDVGKPITDLVVTSRDGNCTWNPFIEDIPTWARRNGIDRYFLHWQEGRGKKHSAISSLIAERIIGAKGLAWIAAVDTELVVWIMESINGHPGQENPIHDLVVRSDQVSVERDLRSLGVAFAGYELGIPVERYLLDIMRRLLKESTWRVNDPGARIWCINGDVYLVWPAAGEEMVAVISSEKIPGLPRSPAGVLEMLVDRNLAALNDLGDSEDRYWVIAPAVLAEKIPNIRLKAIRLRDTTLLFDSPPDSVAGKVLAETASVAPGASSTTIDQTLCEPTPNVAMANPTEAPSAATECSASEEAKSAEDRVTMPSGQNDIAGNALAFLAEELKSGAKKWGSHASIGKDGELIIRWPDAFASQGHITKQLLAALSERQWIILDPMTPLRKVRDVDVDGTGWKAVCLSPSVAQLFGLERQPLLPVEMPKTIRRSFATKPLPDRVIEAIRQARETDSLGGLLDDSGDLLVQFDTAAELLQAKLNVTRAKLLALAAGDFAGIRVVTNDGESYLRVLVGQSRVS